MSLKIIGGLWKGRTLKSPKTTATRPTQGMLREALFNICQNEIENARFLDLFAGSGSVGLEALSRGASHATFVEKDSQALRCIRENVELLKADATIIPYDITTALKNLGKQGAQFDLIYIDPPYGHKHLAEILQTIVDLNLLTQNGRLFLEEAHSSPTVTIPALHLKNQRRYGIAQLTEYNFSNSG